MSSKTAERTLKPFEGKELCEKNSAKTRAFLGNLVEHWFSLSAVLTNFKLKYRK
jgi:hypothetical protein